MADPRGAQFSLIALAVSREFPFMVENGSRRVWDINLGTEIPFFLREKGTTGDAPIAPGAWGLGMWFPVSVHMVEDFRDVGNPIINTDYRAGAAFKVARGLSHLPRDRVFFKVQIGHESSHMSDEFLLNAIAGDGQTFERVDVLHNYIDAGASWDHTLGRQLNGQLTLRASVSKTLNLNGNGGYYIPRLRDGRPLTPSVRNFEPAVGVQYAPLGTKGAGLVVSLDLRQKTIFDFHKAIPSEPEQAQWSYSLMLGIRPLNLKARGTPEFVFKAYYGANPNGMFRTQRDYWLIGTGIHVRV
jgi:hypothetical protein